MHANTANPHEFVITTTEGRSIKLSDFVNNTPVYLKFWASWCQPCREQMPHLQHTFETYGDRIEVIGINLDVNDNAVEVEKTRREFGLSLPIVIDKSGELSQTFDLIATPYHILIDRKGRIVHKGHEASAELDTKIARLAQQRAATLPTVQVHGESDNPLRIDIQQEKPTVVFFSSAWCDWYLEKTRPDMSENCINAQRIVNRLYKEYPRLNWFGVLTRLWTGADEHKEYQKKYDIKYPLAVDTTNDVFFNYRVKDFPTLIVFSNGNEILRFQNFSNPQDISNKFKRAAR